MSRPEPDPDQVPLPLEEAPRPGGLIDLHSHLVPDVDDGADGLDQAVRAVGRMAHAGVRHIVTTPHLDASLIERADAFAEDAATVEAAWERVIAACRGRRPALTFHLGREILLDTQRPVTRDPRVRLARGPYVLVEYPRLNIPHGSEDPLYYIRSQGHHPVVAHVERYHFTEDRDHVLEEWRDAGAVFQVNSASLLGKYGKTAEELAWELLERGWVDLMASDYHARGEPIVRRGFLRLEERAGGDLADLLFRVNPGRVLAGEPLFAAPPIEAPQGAWGKIRAAFRRLGG